MPRFRKSKPPADIPDSTPTSIAELVQHLVSLPRRDSRALAASSTAIALSIGSAFSDVHDTSSDGPAVRGRGTGWQTAYAAVRIAVETVKESSDLCLPLKAVLGAVSVLMKNYDVSVPSLRAKRLLTLRLFPGAQQTTNNTDSVKEIEQRVQSLSGVLASPLSVDDYAERGRRVELQRFVLVRLHTGLLIPLSGSSKGLSGSLNRSLTNMCSLGSYTMLTMPKSSLDLSKSYRMPSWITRY